MRRDLLIRPVREGDAESLTAVLRAADLAEVLAGAREPLDAVRESLRMSEACGALELGGELAALFGVTPGPSEVLVGARPYDIVWCLTGRAVDTHRVAFWRASRMVLADFLTLYPVLFNAIDARYAAALRWAARLGAEVRPAVPWGASDELFHPCFWRA